MLTQALRYNAGRIRVKDCPFGAPDGTTSQFQLADRHGHAVTKDVRIQSIHQTDWQGRVELSNQERTNHVAYSDDPTQTSVWSYQSGGSLGTGRRTGPDGDGQLFEIVPAANASAGMNQLLPLVVSGESVTVSAVVAPTSDQITRLGIFNGSGAGWSGYVDTQWADGIPSGLSSPGAEPVSYQACGDGAYIVSLAVNVDAAAPSPAIHFHCDRNAVENAYVGYLQVVDAPGIYIPTTSAPATVTDYTHDGAGGIALAQTPPAGASLDWTGAARRAA